MPVSKKPTHEIRNTAFERTCCPCAFVLPRIPVWDLGYGLGGHPLEVDFLTHAYYSKLPYWFFSTISGPCFEAAKICRFHKNLRCPALAKENLLGNELSTRTWEALNLRMLVRIITTSLQPSHSCHAWSLYGCNYSSYVMSRNRSIPLPMVGRVDLCMRVNRSLYSAQALYDAKFSLHFTTVLAKLNSQYRDSQLCALNSIQSISTRGLFQLSPRPSQ